MADQFAQVAAMLPSMSLDTPIGDSVIFTGEGGYPADRTQANQSFLVVGLAYTLKSVEIGNWVSYIHLHGIRGSFNSVMFRNS